MINGLDNAYILVQHNHAREIKASPSGITTLNEVRKSQRRRRLNSHPPKPRFELDTNLYRLFAVGRFTSAR